MKALSCEGKKLRLSGQRIVVGSVLAAGFNPDALMMAGLATLVERFPLFWPTTCWDGRGIGLGRGVPGFGLGVRPGRCAWAGIMRPNEAHRTVKVEARKVFMGMRELPKPQELCLP